MSYSNPKLDALIDESNKEFDPAKRNLMMQEITKIIYADQPVTFLNEGKFILEGLNPRIKSPKWLSDYSGGTDSDLFYLN
jgi:ABC-type transport system substrate-binding protein